MFIFLHGREATVRFICCTMSVCSSEPLIRSCPSGYLVLGGNIGSTPMTAGESYSNMLILWYKRLYLGVHVVNRGIISWLKLYEACQNQ